MNDRGLKKLSMAYRKQAIAAMSPRQRIIFTHDLALKAANDGDMSRLRQLLMLMRKNVKLKPNPLIALHFLKIYRHCEIVLEERQDFPEVAKIMFNLKRAFTIAPDAIRTPQSEEAHKRTLKAKRSGALYMGKHGKHYGPKPAKRKSIATGD
jgi:hypothetical protein